MIPIFDRISLSTCWCSGRHTDGYAMVEEMVGLGFKRIELSHGIRVSLVPGILKAIEEGIVSVSSVHNFCPLPNGISSPAPNLFKPSAFDRRELSSWSRYTQQTLNFAQKIGAKKVVMHSGSVRFFFQSPEKRLKQWMQSQPLEASELAKNKVFKRKLGQTMRRIRKASQKTILQIKASYLQAQEWAEEQNLKLCIENRCGLEEMPQDEAFTEFMAELSGSKSIGYWHDTGHAQIKHQFGLLDHRKHLESLQKYLAGFHLHDVTAQGLDHQPIGTGEVDFDMVLSFLRPEHELVLELSPHLKSEDVLASRDYICERVGE